MGEAEGGGQARREEALSTFEKEATVSDGPLSHRVLIAVIGGVFLVIAAMMQGYRPAFIFGNPETHQTSDLASERPEANAAPQTSPVTPAAQIPPSTPSTVDIPAVSPSDRQSSGSSGGADEEAAVKALVTQLAPDIYKAAWPTAKFASVNLGDTVQQPSGDYVALARLTGDGPVNQDTLWVDVRLVFNRSLDLRDISAGSYNGFVPPFSNETMTALASRLRASARPQDKERTQ